MPDPYSSFGTGFENGVNTVSGLVTAKAKSDTNVREAQQAKFDELRKTLDTYSTVLKESKGTKLIPLRQAAADGIAGLMKKHAADIGLDPSKFPDHVQIDDDMANMFSSGIKSLNNMYEKGVTSKSDYMRSMYGLALEYHNQYGEDAPSIIDEAKNMTKDEGKTMNAIIGDKKVVLRQNQAGQWEPAATAAGVPIEGPAVQRVEVVKPPSEAERTNIAQARADIELYDTMLDSVKQNPSWVGIGKDMGATIGATMNVLTPEHNKFVSDVKLNKLKDYKFFMGTAQSKQEQKNAIKAIPDLGMPTKQFIGAVNATKANKERMLKRTMEVLRQSGIRVPEGTDPNKVATIYLHMKGAGKLNPNAKPGASDASTGRPSLDAIFLQSEEENSGE